MGNHEFISGIKIISRCMPESEAQGYNIHAEHDQIWFGEEEWVTDPLDIKALDELGWYVDEGGWCCFV